MKKYFTLIFIFVTTVVFAQNAAIISVSLQNPSFTPASIQNKIDGWWIDGTDQIGSNDLIGTTTYTLPSLLENPTDLISLNDWFVNSTPQAINLTSIAAYCASRQFYNSTNKELIIIKENSHLTNIEEGKLLNYLGISNLSHGYDSKSISLFARFTNTYSDSEKSRIDNVMRLLTSSGVYPKLDHFYLALNSQKEEHLLDWIASSNNLTKSVSGSVVDVPYKGLAPQTGTYYTGVDITTDTNISLNDAFVSFKCGIDFDNAFQSYIYGSGQYFRARPHVVNNKRAYAIELFNSFPFYFTLPVGKGYDDTVVANRKSSTASDVIVGGTVAVLNSTAPSIQVPSAPVKIGGEISTRGNGTNNYVEHLAWGSGLTDIQAIFLSDLIDNISNAQKTLDIQPIVIDGITVTISEKSFIDRLGDQCLWWDLENIYYSTDGGLTISAQTPNPDNMVLDFAHIYDNGKIIFSTYARKIYKTTTSLTSVTEMIPTKNGSTYTLHTPVDSNYGGNYYRYLGAKRKMYVDDGVGGTEEIIVWGAYGNVFTGANPNPIWYSFGDDIKVAFEFAQNPYMTDNGLFIPTQGGNLLGDVTETLQTRHIHEVSQDSQNTNNFYVTMGDFDRLALAPVLVDFTECNLLQLVYNPATSTFSKGIINVGSAFNRVKMGNIAFEGNMAYFSSDAIYQIGSESEQGLFQIATNDIANVLTNSTQWLAPFDFEIPFGKFLFGSNNHLIAGYSSAPNEPGDFNACTIIHSDDRINFTKTVIPIPGNIFFANYIEIAPKKYCLYAMTDQGYSGNYSIILDFN